MDVAEFQRIRFMLGCGNEARALLVRGKHGVDQAQGSARSLLRDRANAPALAVLDMARLALPLAEDEFQERRLAGAVAADQPDLTPVRNCRVGPVQDEAAADAKGDIVDDQHACGSNLEALM